MSNEKNYRILVRLSNGQKKRKSKVVLCDCDYYVNKSAAKSALSREILSTLRSYAFIMFYESSTL